MQHSYKRFADRTQAGIALALELSRRKLHRPLTVLALPRGGVPVAYEVARELYAPLDVLVVRKIGMPGQRELAIGAIASGDVIVHESHIARHLEELNVSFEALEAAERKELQRREHAYRGDAPPLDLKGQTAVLVDDGLATGATMLAAVRAARRAGADTVIVAVPVASDTAVSLVGAEADEVIVLEKPPWFFAIGQWYENFDQVPDEEVCRLLALARHSITGPQTQS